MYAMCIIDAAFDVAELVDLSADHDREPSHLQTLFVTIDLA